ncbi:hypothetical protein GCM10009527_091630 [Actinomadura nitritigenes]|uniref:hypothetical protein n=1 Tax=Actinomadura nitritigenes TaxID=134602 RepID=UPI0027DAF818|nr:hypothetical protein [Actinomadura nitritigenes]
MVAAERRPDSLADLGGARTQSSTRGNLARRRVRPGTSPVRWPRLRLTRRWTADRKYGNGITEDYEALAEKTSR